MGLLVKLYRSLLWLLFLLDTRVPLSTISRFPNLLYEPPKAQVKRHVDTKEAGIVKEVELPLEEAVQRGFTPVWTDGSSKISSITHQRRASHSVYFQEGSSVASTCNKTFSVL